MSASLTIFEKEHAAREKYIYFVCGLAGVLFAYIGKDYFPVHPLDRISILNIGAMISLTFCLAFGMAHIQVYIKGLSINKDVLGADEGLQSLRDCLLKHRSGETNFSLAHKTGKEYKSADDLNEDIGKLQITRDKDHKRMKKWFSWSGFLFFFCHFFWLSDSSCSSVQNLWGKP